jgi:hypothetical protein
MPDTELNMRVMTIQEALEDLGRNPRPFITINRERHLSDIPMPNRLLLEQLRKNGVVDLLIVPTTLVELDAHHLPLCRDREKFIAGELVLIMVTKVHTTPERDVGGQDVEGLEKRARDGLHVTVAMATERLRACADFSEHRKMGAGARRGEIFERLQPLLSDVSARNCFAEGQKRIEDWYPGPTAYRTMKSAYAAVLELLRGGGADPVLAETKQIELVRTASAIYKKAVAFLEAQHATSNMIRELMDSEEFKNATPAEQHDMQARLLREQAPAHHQEMAHNKQGGPSLPQLMRAAAAMDINPAWVFSNVLFYKGELDCAMQLGRAERGVSAILGPEHIKQLKRVMVRADEADGKTDVDAETEAAWRLRDLALGVKTRAGWEEFFAIAESDGREFCITKAQ